MKRVIPFHRSFPLATIFSILLIIFSVVGFFTKGFNLGVDFQAGMNQYIQLAHPAGLISYEGSGSPVMTITDTRLTLVFSSADTIARTVNHDLRTVGTMADLAQALRADAVVFRPNDGGLSADLLVPTHQGNFSLGSTAILVHREPRNDAERYGSIKEIRDAVDRIGTVSIQSLGKSDSGQYIIRVRDDGSDPDFSKNTPVAVKNALDDAFGQDKAITMKTDYVGARFSSNLGKNAIWLVIATLALIMIYASIRFKIQHAIGAVLAIVHDVFIMLGFMIWTSMEFNTLSIAALLTILGYSINNTIVIFDRVREEQKLRPSESIRELIDISISGTLSRTFITTVSTMLAVLSLMIFTTGSISDFARALMVGIIAGAYSSMLIAPGFVDFWGKHFSKKYKHKKA